ncbi:MAG TPA: hypothetical protein VLE93_00225 [Candidatus Saccharimonadales bacterium]|nr:hypothetical protein [Candidatus Saccharimonadales bacterium]
MKKITILLFVVLSAAALAQNVDKFTDQLPVHPISPARPVEIGIRDNGWARCGAPFSDTTVELLLGEMAQDNHVQLGASMAWLLAECQKRDQLSGNRWVNQNSPRLKEGTLQAAQIGWEIVTGGSADSHRDSTSISIGGISVRGDAESGTASAHIAVYMIDLTTGTTLAIAVGRSTHSSTNIGDVHSWFQRANVAIDWSRYNADPAYRRGMLAIADAIENLRPKLSKLLARI